MSQTTFDLAVLRSFVAGMDLGSFAKAADRVGRSTLAVSAQIRKLEEQAGTALFRKSGRGLALTDAGEVMLGYARRLVELNDEAAVAVRGVDLEGWIRLGLQEDFGEIVLPDVLGRFARAHPKVRIEARVARKTELLERIDTGQLDLAHLGRERRDGRTQRRHDRRAADALDRIGGGALAVRFRRAAAAHRVRPALPLSQRGARPRGHQMAGCAFTSPSLSGLWAAAAAGLGVTVRTTYGLPSTVRALDADESGLSALPSIPLALHRASGSASPPVERLASLVMASVREAHVSSETALA
ncbi:putative transcriptional regulator lrhA [Candidatus Paraburkholderia kirkii]|nr:putative transcriptional regulator lrhA [Candidatus Paraburkholderia kirkii]